MTSMSYQGAAEHCINSASLHAWGQAFTKEEMGGGSSALVFRFGVTMAVYVSNGDCEARWPEDEDLAAVIQVVDEGPARDELTVLMEVFATGEGAINRAMSDIDFEYAIYDGLQAAGVKGERT